MKQRSPKAAKPPVTAIKFATERENYRKLVMALVSCAARLQVLADELGHPSAQPISVPALGCFEATEPMMLSGAFNLHTDTTGVYPDGVLLQTPLGVILTKSLAAQGRLELPGA